ncbi:LysR family transcriptional regulator [Glutamicibacter halophytocola]|uniref:LysR family transcriptional regulator n=1 Tax=Glutamicibacter halophytocola TaxID=1933880 RepID=UPI0015587CF7|nr:LysR family transcriptional regulator [Glutamicibacter halophytocola]NQD40197.1 LysR family transcriptional regulator [Glutamicibacter halophytocola]
MDVRQLRYFLAVVDYEGFSRAAEQLMIAQPSLSQTIKALEHEVGVPLFHRVGRRSLLSDAGKELVGPARLVVRDLEAAQSTMASLKGVRHGRLELIAMPSPAVEPLTTLIASYSRQYPRIALSTSAAFTAEDVISAVRSGGAEIGLLGSDKPISAPEVDVVQLERQPLVLVINPEIDDFGDREVIAGADLGGQRIVISQRGSLMRALVDDLRADGVDVEIAAEVAHRSSVLPLVLAGAGHAILPISWAPLARKLGLRIARLEPATELHVALVSRKSDLTPAAQAFLGVASAYADTVSEQHI